MEIKTPEMAAQNTEPTQNQNIQPISDTNQVTDINNTSSLAKPSDPLTVDSTQPESEFRDPFVIDEDLIDRWKLQNDDVPDVERPISRYEETMMNYAMKQQQMADSYANFYAEKNPNAEAHKLKIAIELGVPKGVVDLDPEGTTKALNRKKFHEALRTNPYVMDLIKDPNYLSALSVDDIQKLGQAQGFLGNLKNGAILASKQREYNQLGNELRRYADSGIEAPQNLLDKRESLKKDIDLLQSSGDSISGTTANILTSILLSMGSAWDETLTGTSGGMTMGAVTGGPAGAITGGTLGATIGFIEGTTEDQFEQSAGQLYNDLLDAGVNEKDAASLARSYGLFSASLNLIPGFKISQITSKGAASFASKEAINLRAKAGLIPKAPVNEFLKDSFDVGVTNAVASAIDQYGQNKFYNLGAISSDTPLRGDFDNVLTQGAIGFLGGELMGGFSATPKLITDVRIARQSAKLNNVLDRVETVLSQAEVTKNNPEIATRVFNQLFQTNGHNTVVIRPEGFIDVFNKNPDALVEIKKIIPDIEQRISDAQSNAGNIEISFGTWQSGLLQTPYGAQLKEYRALSDTDLSPFEVAQRIENLSEDLKAQGEKLAKNIKDIAERTKELTEIRGTLRTMMKDTGLYKTHVTHGANLITSFIDTQAKRLGLTPREFLEKSKLNFAQTLDTSTRGKYSPDTHTIFFNPKGDASTVIHEGAHWFLDTIDSFKDNPFFNDDLNTLLNWFGIKREQWDKLSLNEKQKYHERFASAFEEYLAHPRNIKNTKVRKSFDYFGKWMKQAYRDEKGQSIAQNYLAATGEELGVIPDDVKALFDRLLAGDEAAERLVSDQYRPLFDDSNKADWTPEMIADYQKALDDVLDEVKEYLQEKQIQQYHIIGKKRDTLKNRITRQAAQVRKRIETEELQKLHEEPEQKAIDLVKDGSIWLNGEQVQVLNGRHRIDENDLISVLKSANNGELSEADNALLTTLRKKRLISTKGQLVKADFLAKTFRQKDTIQFIRNIANSTLEPKINPNLDKSTARQARYLLSNGTARWGKTQIKLFNKVSGFNHDAVMSILENKPEAVAGLNRRHLLSANGLEPSFVADLIGYADPQKLLENISSLPPLAERLKQRVDARMLAEHLDLATPEGRSRMLDEALAGDAATRLYAVELSALKKIKLNIPEVVQAAKDVAMAAVNKMPIRNLRPDNFRSLERKFNDEAYIALKRGNLDAAAEAKLKAMQNHEMANYAIYVIKERNKLLKTVTSLGRLNPDLFDRNWSLLAEYMAYRVGLRREPQITEAISANMQETNPNAYSALQDMVQNFNYRNFREMNIEEMLDFAGELEGLVVNAHQEKTFAIANLQKSVNGAVKDLIETSQKVMPNRKGLIDFGVAKAPTWIQGAVRKASDLMWQTRTIESLLAEFDGGISTGKTRVGYYTKYIFQPIRDASVAGDIKVEQVTQKLSEIINRIQLDSSKPLEFVSSVTGEKYTFNASKTSKSEILMTLLYAGAPDSWEKLVVGGRTRNKGGVEADRHPWGVLNEDGTLNDTDMKGFIRGLIENGVLTQQDFIEVQNIFNLFKANVPELQQAYFASNGRYFKEIKGDYQLNDIFPESWRMKDKDGKDIPFRLEGGYIPAKLDNTLYDRDAFTEIDSFGIESLAENLPKAQQGFLHDRKRGSFGALTLDLSQLYSSIQAQAWYAKVQPTITNIDKLLRQPEIIRELDRIAPEALTKVIKPWLADVAKRRTVKPSSWPRSVDNIMRLAANRSSMVIMSGNMNNVLQQLTGFGLALTQVNPVDLVGGLAKYLTNPAAVSRSVWEMSPFMNQRHKDLFLWKKDSQLRRNWEMGKARGDSLRKRINRGFLDTIYIFQSALQMFIDNITWLGAYNQFKRNAKNVNLGSLEQIETDARHHADSVIAMTQSSNRVEDTVTLQRNSTAAFRLLYQFQSYFAMIRSLQPEVARRFSFQYGIPYVPAYLASMVMTMYIPQIGSELISNAINGKYSGSSDEDIEKSLKDTFIGAGISGPMAAWIPIFGGFGASNIRKMMGHDVGYVNDSILNPPIVSLIDQGMNTSGRLYETMTGERQLSSKDLQNYFRLVSLVTGVSIPAMTSRQAGAIFDFMQNGVPEDPIEAGRQFISGKASE